jgi:ribosomal protein S18 acetylase RimI-like enzyme
MYRIARVTAVTPELEAAFSRLLPQLAPHAAPLGARELQEIIDGPGTILLVAHDPALDDRIVGSVTAVAFRIPTGPCGRIESLVVDELARGKGLGEALCRDAVARLFELGVAKIDLTSVPSREAANRLYVRLGFQQRATNVYRLTHARLLQGAITRRST